MNISIECLSWSIVYFPGVSLDGGIVLTADHEFFEFEFDLNHGKTQLKSIECWKKITSDVEVTNHKPGTGSTKWYMATEVLDALNEPKTGHHDFVGMYEVLKESIKSER